jgi:choice-of-anchor B domain-containing protein
MKKLLWAVTFALITCSVSSQITYPSSNINLIGFIDPETVMGVDNIKYSGCWGWDQTAKNKEYAIVGSSTGTYFIDITAPATPTVSDYVKGAHTSPCIWREMHTYQNYCYVVSDDSPGNSFQIIDMQYLPDSVHVVYDGKTTYFERAHQINVDGNKLYVSGITFSNSATASMRVYSLATPTAPALLRTLSQDDPSVSYVHDMNVRNDTVFAHCGNAGMRVYKFTASNTFSVLGSLTGYPDAGYNHSSSWTADGKTLVFCDEVPSGLRMKVADVSNLSNITISALFRPNTYSGFTGHNPYIIGNKYAFISCYEDGLNLYDISNPLAPTLLGYFDTYPQGGANMGGNYGSDPENGNWGAYPYFKSGLILACDMQNGVFILGADVFKPAANFNSPAGICIGSSVTFTSVSTNTPTSYSWNMPGASPSTSTLQSPTVSYATPGVYNATLTAANATGSNSVVKSITVTTSPSVTVSGSSTLCAGSPATLTASGASTYTWNPGSLTGVNVVVSPTASVVYTVNGQNGTCSGSNTKSITVTPLPNVTASANPGLMCSGQTVTLMASGGISYTWMPGSITGNPIAITLTTTSTYSVIGTGTASCNKTTPITVSVTACTGIASIGNSEDTGIIVYPNPAGNILNVSIKSNGSEFYNIEIRNIHGQIVFAQKEINEGNHEYVSKTFDTSDLADGIFLVTVSTSYGKSSKRVMIIK